MLSKIGYNDSNSGSLHVVICINLLNDLGLSVTMYNDDRLDDAHGVEGALQPLNGRIKESLHTIEITNNNINAFIVVIGALRQNGRRRHLPRS